MAKSAKQNTGLQLLFAVMLFEVTAAMHFTRYEVVKTQVDMAPAQFAFTRFAHYKALISRVAAA